MDYTQQLSTILEAVSASPIDPTPLAVVELADRIRIATWKLRALATTPELRVSLRAAAMCAFDQFPVPAPSPDASAALKGMVRSLFSDLIKGNLALSHNRKGRKRKLTGLRLSNVAYELTFPGGKTGTLAKASGEWYFDCPAECVRIHSNPRPTVDGPYISPVGPPSYRSCQ